MSVTLTINALDLPDLLTQLSRVSLERAVDASDTCVAAAPTADLHPVVKDSAVLPADYAGRRRPSTTKKKKEPVVSAPVTAPAASAGFEGFADTPSLPAAAPVAEAPKEISIDDVTLKLRAVGVAKDLPTAKKLVESFNVKRVQELKPEQYADFMAAADKILA